MQINANQSAEAANILLSQASTAKTATQANPGALTFTSTAPAANDLQPTPEQLLASTDNNIDDSTAADQNTTAASDAILSQSSLAFAAQGNLNPDVVFQLLAD